MNHKIKIGKYLFIIISVIIVIVMYHIYYTFELKIDDFPLIAFIISVVSSILASLIYTLLNDRFLNTKQDELIAKLTNATDVLETMATKGIIKLQCRDEIREEFWNNFVSNANDTLILSGKTLYRWILFEKRKNKFKRDIIKKIKAGCNVTFIIYKEDRLINEDIEERKMFKRFLFNDIFGKLYKNGDSIEGSLTIKETNVLPYFYITNGVESVVMPYFANVSNNKNLTILLGYDNPLNRVYLEDYLKIIIAAEENSWIQEYKSGNTMP